MTVPSSTYRVQLHADFTFRHLEDILDYLKELGIEAIYLSPITQAVKGSRHGYDVTTPESLNPEIGSEEDMERLSRRLKEYNMCWLQDIVPNHMAFDNSNPWLYDVLERGTVSEYYSFFDIISNNREEEKPNRIMAPFLGKSLLESLEKNEIRLELSDKGFVIRYFDKDYPVSVSSYRWICTKLENCPYGLSDAIVLLEAASGSPVREWHAVKQIFMDKLATTTNWGPYIRRQLLYINERRKLISELVNSQHYTLEDAQKTSFRINYRRFFTINSLICLRMEDEKVFTTWHRKILDWHQKGYIQGLRIDHIDGLAAPQQYIQRLRQTFGENTYIVAEKILAVNESIPAGWALHGTTGYDFLALAGQLFTDQEGFNTLKEYYLTTIEPATPAYEDLVFEKKYHYLKTRMIGELNNLLNLLYTRKLSGPDKVNEERLKTALAILMASFPVYRLYPEQSPSPQTDCDIREHAFRKARLKGRYYALELGIIEESLNDIHFFTRLMQFTGPLAAKGIEDTTFYIYNPLISRNEVGDSPAKDGLTINEFHKKMLERSQVLPDSMNAGSTHDTKRGEDSRIRLNCLSAIPEEWIGILAKCRTANARFLYEQDDQRAVSLNDEYFIYQSLLGALPEDQIIGDKFINRFHNFLTKALREASIHTNYNSPNNHYEDQCHKFVNAILHPGSAFIEIFLPFTAKIIHQAYNFSLGQLLLRLSAPGIPDIYQGAECWDLSLVDPDNRRPVDYSLRKTLLKGLKENEQTGWTALLKFLEANKQAGAGKLFTIYKTLTYRRQFPDVFAKGDYIPLGTPDHHISYLRHHRGNWALVSIPLIRKNIVPAGSIFCDLPKDAPTTWKNIFTGEVIQQNEKGLEITSRFDQFPPVLLTAQSSPL
jgi:(1->4)-alpha-D-glucan 1-alpha-D-glucosylmutase